ncbi:hypothetical protein RHSIM_Rhsim10G0144100 [Rhododendron simsii]|uniref:Uncharacterized protein n=1 Tax=Rhododendron simsii TaxID=118357 RepID=A0A834GCV1_RHOSS|nr:hypothetical protein RHSIM_Rhsim10G0144100 [Rhododendron simsii]
MSFISQVGELGYRASVHSFLLCLREWEKRRQRFYQEALDKEMLYHPIFSWWLLMSSLQQKSCFESDGGYWLSRFPGIRLCPFGEARLLKGRENLNHGVRRQIFNSKNVHLRNDKWLLSPGEVNSIFEVLIAFEDRADELVWHFSSKGKYPSLQSIMHWKVNMLDGLDNEKDRMDFLSRASTLDGSIYQLWKELPNLPIPIRGAETVPITGSLLRGVVSSLSCEASMLASESRAAVAVNMPGTYQALRSKVTTNRRANEADKSLHKKNQKQLRLPPSPPQANP